MPPRGWGQVCLSVVLEPVLEQDIALPLYMKRIHHLRLHRMNYVPSVSRRQSRVKLEGKREKLAKILCGIKDFKIKFLRSWSSRDSLWLVIFKALKIHLRYLHFRPTITVIANSQCARASDCTLICSVMDGAMFKKVFANVSLHSTNVLDLKAPHSGSC